MSSKKAAAIWILTVFTFLSTLGTLHAWISWQISGLSTVDLFTFAIEVIPYFIITLMATVMFIGAACHVAFRSESFEIQFFQLGKDFDDKLEAKSEDIKQSTDEALAKLGLQEFQVKENMKELQKTLGEFDTKFAESASSNEKILKRTQKKLMDIELRISKIQAAQKDLPKIEKKIETVEAVQKDVKEIQGIVKKLNSIPEPNLTSTDDIKVLEGKVMKRGTVQKLKTNGIRKVEDLLLKSPLEIGITKAMSESEAKSLQSVMQLMMIPGIQHEDAMLLLKSGVGSKQELALQDEFTLGGKVSKVADLYSKEGKIKEKDKPTLEEIASWIKLAKAS